MKYWHAVQTSIEDTNLGTGSFDFNEALRMAKQYPESMIAVIDGEYDEDGNATVEPICIDVLWPSDFED